MGKRDEGTKVNAKYLMSRMTDANTDLNVFASLVSMLEGGHLYSSKQRTHRAAERIIKICQEEQQWLLSNHDRAAATLTALIAAETDHG